MNKTFKEAIQLRRSNYSLTNKSPVSDKEIEDLIQFAVKHVPSAYNSQSTRILLLLNEHHQMFWDLVKQEVKKVAPEAVYPNTVKKIDQSFASGYGTVLFFEDDAVIQELQENFSPYAANFPKWAHQTSAMHQFVVWTGLAELGLGASIQHYNPLINEVVQKKWDLPKSWTLMAQMPFGTPSAAPNEKTFKPFSERIKVFK